MTWDNYSYYGWHIDHIIPLSSANSDEELMNKIIELDKENFFCKY